MIIRTQTILLILIATSIGNPLFLAAGNKTYVLSYSPGTLFHQLVRDRAKEVYEKAGLKTELVALPHNRSLISANDGSVDGDVGRVPSVEQKYPNLKRVNVKLMETSGAVYTTKQDIDSYDESLLTKQRVGYVLGVRWQQKKMEGLEATTAPDYQALFEMLLQERVDIVLATVASADAALRQLGERAKKIHKLQPFVFTAPIYHYVNKKNEDIIPLLERTINEMNEAWVLDFYTGVQPPLLEILQGRLQEACRRIGRICEVHSSGSAQRALLMANVEGDGDALRGPDLKELDSTGSSNLLQIPEPILNTAFYVYSWKGDMQINGVNALDGLQNGIRIGVKFLEKNIPAEQVLLPDSERLFKMLHEKRLDTVSEHVDIADYILRKEKLSGIHKLTPPLMTFVGYSFLHKKHKDLVPRIAGTLKEMKVDGSFDRIKNEAVEQLFAQ